MDNAASRKEIRRKEKEARLAEKTRGTVIIDLMSGKSGRGYVWDILAAAHVFSTSYSPDALQMAFAEGERNSGLRLLDDILQWCPEQFIQMMREQNERRILDTPDDSGTDADAYPDDADDGPAPGYDVYRADP